MGPWVQLFGYLIRCEETERLFLGKEQLFALGYPCMGAVSTTAEVETLFALVLFQDTISIIVKHIWIYMVSYIHVPPS